MRKFVIIRNNNNIITTLTYRCHVYVTDTMCQRDRDNFIEENADDGHFVVCTYKQVIY